MPSARSSLLAGVSIRRNQCRRLLVENAEFVDVTDNSAVELTRDRAGQRWRSRHREILSRMVRETEPPTDSLPRMQRLTEVWRLRDPGERDASFALRSARGNRLRKAIGWYRTHDRLHTVDAIAMAADATAATSKPVLKVKVLRSFVTPGKSPTPSTNASTIGSPTPMCRAWRWLAIRKSALATSSSVATTMPA